MLCYYVILGRVGKDRMGWFVWECIDLSIFLLTTSIYLKKHCPSSYRLSVFLKKTLKGFKPPLRSLFQWWCSLSHLVLWGVNADIKHLIWANFRRRKSNQCENTKIHIPMASAMCFRGYLVAKPSYNWRSYATPRWRRTIGAHQSWVTKKKHRLVCLGISSEITHTHNHFSTHIHLLSAFCTLLHQSVPKLFPHFGEFPRLISWH